MSPEDILNNFNGVTDKLHFKVNCVTLEDDPIHNDFYTYFTFVNDRKNSNSHAVFINSPNLFGDKFDTIVVIILKLKSGNEK
jgi:hypothetical protein